MKQSLLLVSFVLCVFYFFPTHSMQKGKDKLRAESKQHNFLRTYLLSIGDPINGMPKIHYALSRGDLKN